VAAARRQPRGGTGCARGGRTLTFPANLRRGHLLDRRARWPQGALAPAGVARGRVGWARRGQRGSLIGGAPWVDATPGVRREWMAVSRCLSLPLKRVRGVGGAAGDHPRGGASARWCTSATVGRGRDSSRWRYELTTETPRAQRQQNRIPLCVLRVSVVNVTWGVHRGVGRGVASPSGRRGSRRGAPAPGGSAAGAVEPWPQGEPRGRVGAGGVRRGNPAAPAVALASAIGGGAAARSRGGWAPPTAGGRRGRRQACAPRRRGGRGPASPPGSSRRRWW